MTGALAGLKADIASGGLTLGGGLLAGGVIGALTAAGAARGVNLVRGVSQAELRWDPRVLDALLASALLGYLAIAHHGRGRGAWVAQEPPAAWVSAVDAAMARQLSALQALWRRGDVGETREEALSLHMRSLVETACTELLEQLYPACRSLWPR